MRVLGSFWWFIIGKYGWWCLMYGVLMIDCHVNTWLISWSMMINDGSWLRWRSGQMKNPCHPKALVIPCHSGRRQLSHVAPSSWVIKSSPKKVGNLITFHQIVGGGLRATKNQRYGCSSKCTKKWFVGDVNGVQGPTSINCVAMSYWSQACGCPARRAQPGVKASTTIKTPYIKHHQPYFPTTSHVLTWQSSIT